MKARKNDLQEQVKNLPGLCPDPKLLKGEGTAKKYISVTKRWFMKKAWLSKKNNQANKRVSDSFLKNEFISFGDKKVMIKKIISQHVHI